VNNLVNILLVDDSDYIKETLKMILKSAGHDVVGEAANAKEALAKYKALHPDIVLLDIVLKQADGLETGIEALKEIINEDPLAKIFVVSALNQNALINKVLKLGAKGFIAKPFEPEKLLQTVIT
jgi:two-component system chemotaxis response regulator CheY